MKKKFILIIALVLTAVFTAGFLTACGGDDGSGGDFEYGSEYIKNHLGTNYSITYKFTSFVDGKESNYSQTNIRTSEGVYLSVSSDTGSSIIHYLWIKNPSGKYDYYTGNPTDGFSKTSLEYTESEIDLQSTVFLEYMSSYNVYKSGLKKDGTATVAGKSCEKYTYNYSYPGHGTYKFSYWIDKASGVCLKYAWDVVVSGEGSGGYTFECTEFKIGNAELPRYSPA